MIHNYKLYDNSVHMAFDPDAPRYRYRVSDPGLNIKDKPMRGVTTLLRDVLHKPDLLMWPMNEAMTVLFGQEFDSKTKEYLYKPSKALLKPGTAYGAEQLQEALETARAAHRAKSDRGKDVGSMVHSAIEMYLNGIKGAPEGFEEANEKDQKAVRKALARFIKWWESHREAEAIAIESPVYSRRLQFAGTFDLIARINGKIYMLDVKTTNRSHAAPLGIYPEYFLQLGAYSYAVREERGYKFDDCGVINVGKDGSLNVATATDMGITVAQCEEAFSHAVAVHDWLESTSRLTSDRHFVSHLNPLAKVETPAADK